MNKVTLACITLAISISSIYSAKTQAHAIWFAERSSQLALIYGEGAQDLDTVKRQDKVKRVTGYNKNWQEQSAKLVESGHMMILSDNTVYAVTGMLDNGLWSKTKDGKWKKLYVKTVVSKWKENGDCVVAEDWMRQNCKKTCKYCDPNNPRPSSKLVQIHL